MRNFWNRLRSLAWHYLRIFVSVGATIVAIGLGMTFFPFITLMLVVTFATVMTILYVMVVVPHAVDALTNRPNRLRPEGMNELGYGPSRFGFFTYLEPGRVKMIERGKRFVRAIMDYEGNTFRGEKANSNLRPRDDKYWEVEDSGEFNDAHPLPFPGQKLGWYFFVWAFYSPLSLQWWLWKRFVYMVTGAVFTGISPFQTVRIYPLERLKEITKRDGIVELVRVEDYSDHYRVADFLYPILIPDADTQDKLPVKIHIDLIGQVRNPFQTAYNTDNDWNKRLLTSVSDKITTFTRSRSLDAVLSATDDAQARQIQEAVVAVGARAGAETTWGPLGRIGISIKEAQIRDISPSDPKTQTGRKISDLAIARVDRKAMEERAKGAAAQIRETGKALEEQPAGSVIPTIEGNVRAAQAIGPGGILILGGTQAVDPTQAAILQELRQQRSRQGKGSRP